MESGNKRLESFKNLGSSKNLPILGMIFGVERCTMYLYISNISSTITILDHSRWHLFCKNHYGGEHQRWM